MRSTFDAISQLGLEVEGYSLQRLTSAGAGFTRVSTLITLAGGGLEGVGEDVTYAAEDHEALIAAGPTLPLAGSWTIESFSAHLAGLDTFPAPPQSEVYRHYRAWGFEAAALDLALAQAGISLHAALGREPRPLTFVASVRLAEPPTLEPVEARLAGHAGLRFKLDPTPSWDMALIAELSARQLVATADLKGLYSGTVVDNAADPDLYRRIAEGLPDAWIEDPMLTPETDAVLAAHRDRITWDAPIHGVADVLALPFPPRALNVKPSRFGTLRGLLDFYDHCAKNDISCYGGGQTEIGVGRGQIQYLASLFHPDAPNDVAPAGYNADPLPAGLEGSPLAPAPSTTGFRWGLLSTDRWAFRHVDEVRFADLDVQSHLNNVAFHVFFESARVAYFHALMPEHDPARGELGVMVAETKVTFRSPGQLGDQIETLIAPVYVGRSSFRLRFEMRVGERVIADGYGVLVFVDRRSGRPAPLLGAMRERLLADGAQER